MLAWHRLLSLVLTVAPGTSGNRQQGSPDQSVDEFETPVRRPARPLPTQARDSASTTAPGWTGYRGELAFNLGIGSAIGEVGVTGAFWPAPFLGTEVGLGYGVTGTQYSLMEKVAVGRPDSAIRFVSGAGVAFASGSSYSPERSLWLNLDAAGLEVRSKRHFVFFLAGGLTIGLAGGRFQGGLMPETDCSPYPDCTLRSKVPGYLAPQLRLGLLGFWFGP